MGYDTYFNGEFELDKLLSDDQREFLDMWLNGDHVARDPALLKKADCSKRNLECLNLLDRLGMELGEECVNYVGQFNDGTTLSHDVAALPGRHCVWEISRRGATISSERGTNEDYVAWLRYIIEHFLIPWGYVLNGECYWDGDQNDDKGEIEIENNVIKVYDMVPTYVLRGGD